MGLIDSAKKRLRQRSKLPTGDHIIEKYCFQCRTPILCWNDDPILSPHNPHRFLCSYCKQAERAYNAAIFSKTSGREI